MNFTSRFRDRSSMSCAKDQIDSQVAGLRWSVFRHTGNRRFQILVAVVFLLWLTAANPTYAQVTRSFTEPVQFSNVAASEPGVLRQIMVREGDRVTVGQPLAQLDSQVLQQSLQIAILHAESDARVRSAAANLRIFQKKYDKLQPLLAAGHANNAEVEKAQAEFESAQAEFEIAKQKSNEDQLEVRKIRAEIAQREIHSPIDGWVTEIHHRVGEYISGNNPQVTTVVRLDQLRVRFYLHAAEIEKLRVAQPVTVLMGEPQQQVKATVEFISPVTDPNSGTTRIDVLVDNASLQFRSGIPCEYVGAGIGPDQNSEHVAGGETSR